MCRPTRHPLDYIVNQFRQPWPATIRPVRRRAAPLTTVGTPGDALRWPRAIARDHAHDALESARIREQTDGRACEIGYMHSHPTRNSMPSETDSVHASQMRALLGLSTFLAVIATPGDRGWGDCRFHGRVVRPIASGHDVCESCNVI